MDERIPPGHRKPKMKRTNPWGVDAPITRMALAMIYLSTGKAPTGMTEAWLDRLPLTGKTKDNA